MEIGRVVFLASKWAKNGCTSDNASNPVKQCGQIIPRCSCSVETEPSTLWYNRSVFWPCEHPLRTISKFKGKVIDEETGKQFTQHSRIKTYSGSHKLIEVLYEHSYIGKNIQHRILPTFLLLSRSPFPIPEIATVSERVRGLSSEAKGKNLVHYPAQPNRTSAKLLIYTFLAAFFRCVRVYKSVGRFIFHGFVKT